MKFLKARASESGASSHHVFYDYFRYLDSNKTRIPKNVYKFATAEWHYNPDDHRCPHDIWLNFCRIEELSSGTRSEQRTVDIKMQLLGAYHDGYIELHYHDVSSYSLGGHKADGPHKNADGGYPIGHGDWLQDEITVSDDGQILHEIVFSTGTVFKITFFNLDYSWTPRFIQ